MTIPSVGILSAASILPHRTVSIDDILVDEGIRIEREARARLGVERVHVHDGDDATEMAVEVCEAVLHRAGLNALDVDAIIDFSVMPQKYVEPAWSMSNEIQAALAAKNAFTLGFSGGGCANIHVAIKFGRSLIQANDDIDTVLLVASDRAIPGNRVINRENPITVLGDAASALLLQRSAPVATIIDTAIVSDGSLHDVFNIPGGGIAHPTRLDLYKLVIDPEKYRAGAQGKVLKRLSDDMLRKHFLDNSSVDHFITANLSREDLADFSDALNAGNRLARTNIAECGHVHSTDLVLNYLSLEQSGIESGDYVMMASHGLGFLAGATLVKY